MRTVLFWLGVGLVAGCGSSGNHTGDGGTGDATSTTDGALGVACGGSSHVACTASQYCDYPDNLCGTGDATGACKPRPAVCPQVAGPPSCGCDDKVHVSDCATNTAGFDVNAAGTCSVPAGEFACGDTQCMIANQYCRRAPQATGPETFSCVDLAPACPEPATCGCLAGEDCGTMCSGSGSSGLTLTCS